MESILFGKIAQWLNTNTKDPSILIKDISIDSRINIPSNLFIALRGEHFDGHDFIEQAIQNGSIAAIVSRDIKNNIPFIKVKDTHYALRKIAEEYLNQFNLTKIAITGSTGKTTLKDFLSCSIKHNIIKTKGNMNNLIGVPLTIFNINKKTEYAIIEAGMNQAGELEKISKIIKPNIVIITAINNTHIGNFNSFEELINEKMSILKYASNDTLLFINGDNEHILKFIPKNQKYITFGIKKHNDYYCDSFEITKDKTKISINNNTYITNTLGIGIVYSILCLYALSRELKDIDLDIEYALKHFAPPKGRMNIINIANITIIDDTYNASPKSMENAINILSKYTHRKIAVLGDMLELGKDAKTMHEQLAEKLKQSDIDIIILYGKYMKYTYKKMKNNAMYFENKDDIFDYLIKSVKQNDTLLFKASRAINMETVLEKLKEYYAV